MIVVAVLGLLIDLVCADTSTAGVVPTPAPHRRAHGERGS